MVNLRNVGWVVVAGALMLGCSSIELDQEAHGVVVSKTAVGASCEFLGKVVGTDGGYLSGGNPYEASMNDLRNKAHALGANYVLLESTRKRPVREIGGARVTREGLAYNCPKQ